MAFIDHTNYATTLKQSSSSRSNNPNGNVYFNTALGLIELIGADELPMVDFGAGMVTNPLNNFDRITLRALYNFENLRRAADLTLSRFKRGVKGSYRFAGAYNFVNGIKLSGSDRSKIGGSGFIEYAEAGNGETYEDRVYHGVKSLVDIQPSSTPFYALVTASDEASLLVANWTSFVRQGDIDEVVQVKGTTAYGDTTAGNFDYTTRNLVVRVRSWQYTPGETNSVLTGLSELSGFSAGYGVGEALNTNNTYALAQVYGPSAVAPWTGMSLEKMTIPQVEMGFNEPNGTFTWVLHNTAGGTVRECAAYLDALSIQNTDVDSGSSDYNGKKGRVWYYRNTLGKVVTNSFSGQGLFVEGLTVAEKQNIISTDDSLAVKTYPFFPSIELNVGAVAASDPKAWFKLLYVTGAGGADFDTASAVVVKDGSGADIVGTVAAHGSSALLSFSYDYDGNTQAGLAAGTDKEMVAMVEGDGIAAQAITYFRMTRSTTITVTCAPILDNNA